MNKYCENCFYWVNRKEENPNKSNCDNCKSNPYNIYEGVVLKCRDEKELKLAEKFFIDRGIPVGINKFIDMYPCYIGIDEHQVKSRFSFTTFKVFYNKNIIFGESNYKNEFVTWAGYRCMTIDEYLSTTVKSEKEDLLDKKEITINTNSSVVGYIAGYHIAGENNISCYTKNKSEFPIDEELNSYEGYFIRLWDLDSTYENIIKFFNEVAKIPYSNSGGIVLGYISTYIGIHKGKIKMMSASKLNNLRDKGELKFVCDIIKTNEKEGTISYNFYKGDKFAGVDCYWNKSNHDDKYEFSITIYKSKENQNPTKEDLKEVCNCQCNKSESPSEEDLKNNSESPYKKWDKYFVKVRNKEEYLTILNWWNKQGVVIANSIFLYPSEYPAYIGVNNYSFIANLTEEGFKQIKSPVLIRQIQDDKTGEVIYTSLNKKDSKKETKTEIPNMGGFHCDMNLTGYVTNTGYVGYETNTGHVTGNQTTYISPGNFYTMSTEEKLNYLYKLILNK